MKGIYLIADVIDQLITILHLGRESMRDNPKSRIPNVLIFVSHRPIHCIPLQNADPDTKNPTSLVYPSICANTHALNIHTNTICSAMEGALPCLDFIFSHGPRMFATVSRRCLND